MIYSDRKIWCFLGKPINYVYRIAIWAIILNASHGLAQDTLTLEKAIEISLENNFQIQIARGQTDIASNNNSWGTAGRYPIITMGLNFNASNKNGVDPQYQMMADSAQISTQQDLFLTPSVNLNWILFDGFKVNIRKSQLEEMQRLSEGNLAIATENTLQSVILAYNFAILQKESLEIINEIKALSADRYQYLLQKKELGVATTFDLLQAESNYYADSANALQLEISLQNALRNLNLIMATPMDHAYVLDTSSMIIFKDLEPADLISKMESNNKTIKNQYINQEILLKNIKLSKSELYPTLSLSAGINNSYYNQYGDWDHFIADNTGLQTTVGLNLTYTLSNGGNIRRAIRNAGIEYDISETRLEEMVRTMTNELMREYENYTLTKRLFEVAELNTRSSKLNLQIAKDKFKSGSINSFNYRDIQIAYLNAARHKQEIEYQLISSYIKLLRLTGSIISDHGK